MSTLDLTGLKAHHPLGFLAACGLLRCVTESNAFGSARLGWHSAQRRKSFAVIYSEAPLKIDSIARMLLHVGEQQRGSPAWTWSTKIDDRAKYRIVSETVVGELLNGARRDEADMLAALASDLAAEGEALQPTAFDLTSGNQGLLKSFIDISDWSEVRQAKEALVNVEATDDETKKRKAQAKLDEALAKARAQFEEALSGPWTYQDAHHSLGWDPQAQRLHALRGKLPEKDKERRSVRAAVFLSSLALPMFPCFAVGGSLQTTGFHRHDNDNWLAWPIWRDPISLATLRSLLTHPFSGDLKERGVEVVYRCRCARTGGSEGDYRVFSHPEERPWPRPGPRPATWKAHQ